MGRLTYFFLQTALFFAMGIVLQNLGYPAPAGVLIVLGILIGLAGAGEANSGRHNR